MKFINKLNLVILAVASLCFVFPAQAQRGFDVYAGSVRTVVLAPPYLYTGGAAMNAGTNGWVDCKGFDGMAKIDFASVTNVGNSTFTVTVQTSTDQTNLVTLANASYASATSIVYTNFFYSGYPTNLITATDNYLLPGSIVTPSAASAGWATPYLNVSANPYTNTVSAMTITTNGVQQVGFNIGDALRYLRVIVTPGGGATNGCVSAVLTAHTSYTTYPF